MPITDIQILGEKLSIKGDASVERTQEIAAFIDKSIKDIYSKYPNMQPKKALILALFNVSEQLKDLQEAQDDITKDIAETTNILAELFD